MAETEQTRSLHESSTPATTGRPSTEFELVQVLHFFRRRWLLITTMTILTTAAVLTLLVVRGATYRVSATIFFKLGPEMAPSPMLNREPIMVTRRQEDVKNEIEILTSPHLIHQVVEDLGDAFFQAPQPTTWSGRIKRMVSNSITMVKSAFEEVLIRAGLRRRLTKLEKAKLAVQGMLTVAPIRDSDVVSVTLEIADPNAGVFILERLLDAYLESHLAAHQDTGVQEFFTSETAFGVFQSGENPGNPGFLRVGSPVTPPRLRDYRDFFFDGTMTV